MQRSHTVTNGISFIVATLGEHDIRPLLDSLEKQSCDKYECIIIDQSKERVVQPVICGYRNIKYLHSDRKGNSYNRNIGIQNAQMPILGFPDDDCFYSADVIEKVLKLLHIHQRIDGVSGNWLDSKTGNLVMGSRKLNYANIFNLWTSITNITIFLRATIVRRVYGYNENFGLGSGVFEGGEETDFFLKIIKKGGKILFSPEIQIWHKSENYTISNPKKQWGYEESWGALFRKWCSPDINGAIMLITFIYFLLRSFLRALFFALHGNLNNSKLYLLKNKARIYGWKKYGAFKNLMEK